MSRIRGRDTSHEITLRKALFREGYRYSLNYRFKYMNFIPDIVMVSRKTCIFLDGCFWHRCPICYRPPKSNKRFWISKATRNVERDKQQNTHLKENGWKVIRVWEHALKKDFESTFKNVVEKIEESSKYKKKRRRLFRDLR